MQPQRERVKLGKDRNWWRLLPVLGALGLISLMLVLTFMPSKLDEAHVESTAVALLGSTTPMSTPSPTMVDSPFPTTMFREPPPIQILPADQGEVRLATIEPATTSVPTKDLHDAELLPTIVPVLELSKATITAQPPTLLPTLTALPTPAEAAHIYALINHATLLQDQLVRVEADRLIPIVTVDRSTERFMALLPDQQTLLISRNQMLVAINLTTGQTRWNHPLLPKSSLDYGSRLTLDQAGTGVYLFDQNGREPLWRWSHLAIQDGQLLNSPQQVSLAGDRFTLTSDGKIWVIENRKLFQFDPTTNTKRGFGSGLLSHSEIIGNGRQPLLGVLREPTKLSLIDWATGNERQVSLNPPFQGGVMNASFSEDQSILVVRSNVANINPNLVGHGKFLLSAYSLKTGSLIATRNIGDSSLFYPTLTADQWLIELADRSSAQRTLMRWNVATNQLEEVVGPKGWSGSKVKWICELAGAAINPVSAELQVAVTPLPTDESRANQSSLPTIEPPSNQPVAIFGHQRGNEFSVKRLIGRSAELLDEAVINLFPRYNQAPFVLQRPQAQQWQVLDPITQQKVEWQFEQIIRPEESNFRPLLAPNYQSMLAVVTQDLRSNDQFTGTSQLVQINLQTSAWTVLADSHMWPELQWVKPLAWQGDSVYFLQPSNGAELLWRVQFGPPFQAEQIAQIPSTMQRELNATSTPISAEVYVAPNQRWLLYPLAVDNKTMVLRILDLVKQQSHDLAMPLKSLHDLSFSPESNSFAFMLPSAMTNRGIPALYQLEEQRWYQLDSGMYGSLYGETPFLWSPDGHWLAIDFKKISRNEERLNIYNSRQPSLTLSTNLDFIKVAIALDNDGKTIITDHAWERSLEQLTWDDQAWQINWRINNLFNSFEQIYYLYPR
ncbi:hypothetical protein [Herpetosiphon llansteffanensis]|uniref:hypothetical protein n=1 Tax=Herpetosiphon llansteffanensis TaxID=2094568 RepID=UPI000D7D1CA0|nr:hypothetical protein [Herpetosiphon llansteffanensis]